MTRLKKWLHGIWISLTIALGVQYERPATMEHTAPTEIVHATPSPVPPPMNPIVDRPRMVISSIAGATIEEAEQVELGNALANQVLASDWFKGKVLSGHFTETNGMTNAQIYAHIAKAPQKVKVEIYDGSWKENYVWKTMGYDIGDGVVYMNRFYFNGAKQSGSLETHEGEGHGQGFRHEYEKSTSVPYQWNDLIEEGYEVLGL